MLHLARVKWIGMLLSACALLPFVYGVEWLQAALSPCETSTTTILVSSQQQSGWEPIEEELWEWVWGAAYNEDTSVITLEASGNSYDATAWSDEEPEDVVVGTGTFTPSLEFYLGSVTTTEFDTASGSWVEFDLASIVASGTFESDATQERSTLLASIVRASVTALDGSGNSFVAYMFSPVVFTEDIPVGDELSTQVYSAATEMGPTPPESLSLMGGTMAQASGGGGTLFPCLVGVPYEELSCECKCVADLEMAKAACNETLEDFLVYCFGGAVLFLVACFWACGWAGPLCFNACIRFVLKPARLCVLTAIGNYMWCITQADNAYDLCIARCPGK